MTRESGTIVRLRDMDTHNVYTNYMAVLLQVNGAASVEGIIGRPTVAPLGQTQASLPVRQGTVDDAGARGVTADVVRQELRLERVGTVRPLAKIPPRRARLARQSGQPSSSFLRSEHSGVEPQFCFAGRLCLAGVIGAPRPEHVIGDLFVAVFTQFEDVSEQRLKSGTAMRFSWCSKLSQNVTINASRCSKSLCTV